MEKFKIKSMLSCPLTYIHFKIYVEDPDFRKKGNGNNISRVIERIKKDVRGKWKAGVKNYVYDNIVHICDNFDQTIKTEKIIKKYGKYMKKTFINLKYFLKCNFVNGMFNRADMLVRKYSIEQYLKKDECDFNLYIEMQKRRCPDNTASAEEQLRKFKILADSIVKKSFDDNRPIVCGNNFDLMDGSHRLSLLYL